MESLKLKDHGQLQYYFLCVLVAIFRGLRGELGSLFGGIEPPKPPYLGASTGWWTYPNRNYSILNATWIWWETLKQCVTDKGKMQNEVSSELVNRNTYDVYKILSTKKYALYSRTLQYIYANFKVPLNKWVCDFLPSNCHVYNQMHEITKAN